MIDIGFLVRSQNNNLGIGKVIDISDTNAIVEYFCSIGQRIEKTLPLNSLSHVILQRQTRCYVWSESLDTWNIGRVYEWDENNEEYQIDLPDRKTIIISEEEIYVRCNLPQADPIETLAIKGQETPYFHDRRFGFVKSLISQRSVSWGMTGLISANIKLYPHQVEVVRRVLEDPIQRYLLADEVGLGKTIEAGTILRQYLLDEPSESSAVVLVPQYLLQQWHEELENKFYLSCFPNRVKLVAIEDVSQISQYAQLDFLILDEAHNIAAMAMSADPIKRKCFERCRHLAHKSSRLLLLSATPVLNNEQDFLAMLHLLDPITYKLDDLAGFRARVKERQNVGKILVSFKEGANSLVLQTNMKQLCSLFPEDKYLLNLVNELKKNLEVDVSIRDKIIRAIRSHISDTYRLHQRMLRNRRISVEDVIFDRNLTPKVEYDLDERSPDIHEIIEQWRNLAPDEENYRHIYLLLFRASGTWLGILAQVIQARLNSKSTKELIGEFGNDSVKILTGTAKFNGEDEILRSLLAIIQQPSEDGDRLELLKIVILYQLAENFKLQSFRSNLDKLLSEVQQRIKKPIAGDKLPKIVVFSSFVQACAEIVRYLENTFGKESVASHQFGQTRVQVENSLNRFKNDRNCFILVCDSSGEEGRNLQFVDWMINFDIPWSPNSLEQRIGRIDRIGRSLKVDFTVFAGADLEDSPHDAWYRLLKDGFSIFNQSIASFQFYIDEKLAELEATLFQSRAKGILGTIETIQQEINAEQVKISEQNALDEIDSLDESATEYFQALDDYDARHQEMQWATENWICEALKFRRINDTNLSFVQRYRPTTGTLVSMDELKSRFAAFADNVGTFNRRVANEHPGVHLYRIGEEFVEALSSYVQWDDRGQAYAMWRVEESWDSREGMEWFGFRFNYIVETNLTNHTQDAEENKVLQRRADGLFPPIVKSIFVDAASESMSTVEDQKLLNILQRPYKSKGNKNRDYNLAKSRLRILDNFVEPDKWQDFCRQARNTSLELLKQQPDFKELCEKSALRAEQKLGRRLEQLRLRQNQLADTDLAEELSSETAFFDTIVQGIRHPRIHLDSVGFIIISGREPVEFEEGDD